MVECPNSIIQIIPSKSIVSRWVEKSRKVGASMCVRLFCYVCISRAVSACYMFLILAQALFCVLLMLTFAVPEDWKTVNWVNLCRQHQKMIPKPLSKSFTTNFAPEAFERKNWRTCLWTTVATRMFQSGECVSLALEGHVSSEWSQLMKRSGCEAFRHQS